MCKHLWAVEYVRLQVTDANGNTATAEQLTIKRVSYPQDWPAYNAAQCAEKGEVQRLLRGLCDGIVQPVQPGQTTVAPEAPARRCRVRRDDEGLHNVLRAPSDDRHSRMRDEGVCGSRAPLQLDFSGTWNRLP